MRFNQRKQRKKEYKFTVSKTEEKTIFEMRNLLNWKTTVTGIVTALVQVLDVLGFEIPMNIETIMVFIASLILMVFARDGDEKNPNDPTIRRGVKFILILCLFGLGPVTESQAQVNGNFKSVRFVNNEPEAQIDSINGTIIYNRDSLKFRAFENGVWKDLIGGGGGGGSDGSNIPSNPTELIFKDNNGVVRGTPRLTYDTIVSQLVFGVNNTISSPLTRSTIFGDNNTFTEVGSGIIEDIRVFSGFVNVTSSGAFRGVDGLSVLGGFSHSASNSSASGSLFTPTFIGGDGNSISKTGGLNEGAHVIIGGLGNDMVSNVSANRAAMIGGQNNALTDGVFGVLIGGTNTQLTGGSSSVMIASPLSTLTAQAGGEANGVINSRDSDLTTTTGISNTILGSSGGTLTTTNGQINSLIATFNGQVLQTDPGPLSTFGNTLVGGNGNTIDNTASGRPTWNAIFSGRDNDLLGSTNSGVIVGELNEVFESDNSATLAGENNHLLTATHSLILGGQNDSLNATGDHQAILSALDSDIIENGGLTQRNVIFGGENQRIESTPTNGAFENVIIGGALNTVSGVSNSGIFSTENSTIENGGNNNVIVGTENGSITATGSAGVSQSGTFAGFNNIVRSTDATIDQYNVVVGGLNNTVEDELSSAILGGDNNTLTSSSSSGRNIAIGGSNNQVTGGNDKIIIGGSFNTLAGTPSSNKVIISSNESLMTGGNTNGIFVSSQSEISGSNAGNARNAIIGGFQDSILVDVQNVVILGESGRVAVSGLNNAVYLENLVEDGVHIKTDTFQIFNWDMDVTASITTNIDSKVTNESGVIAMDCIVLDDNGNPFPLTSDLGNDGTMDGSIRGTISNPSDGNIVTQRVAGQGFDNVNFDTATGLRGVLTVKWTP